MEPLCTDPALYLDFQLAARLNAWLGFSGSVPRPAGRGGADADAARLRTALGLWRFEKLCDTLRKAGGESRAYRASLEGRALDLMREAAAAAGVALQADGTLPRKARERLIETTSPERSDRLERALSALLRSLPPTRPEHLAQDPEAFLRVSHSRVEGLISLPTSGTSSAAQGAGAGHGKRVFCTRGDLAETADFFRHGMRYLVSPGQRVALLMSGERPGSVGDLLARGLAEIGVPCTVPGFVPPCEAGEKALLERLVSEAPACLVGLPAQVLRLARSGSGTRLGKGLSRSVRTVLLSGEAAPLALKKGIAEALGCTVFTHYGLTETGLGGAVECRARSGCHMREADLAFEIVDDAGEPLGPGRLGEIVISTLTREAMPLLRYFTGDEGLLEPGDCACGSVFRRLRVRGRLSERLALPSCGPEREFIRLADFDSVLYALPFIKAYSAVWHRPEGCLALELALAAGAPDDALAIAKGRLGALNGIRLVRSADDLAACRKLPVLARCEPAPEGRPSTGPHQGAGGPYQETGWPVQEAGWFPAPRPRGQSKRGIVHSDEPLFLKSAKG